LRTTCLALKNLVDTSLRLHILCQATILYRVHKALTQKNPKPLLRAGVDLAGASRCRDVTCPERVERREDQWSDLRSKVGPWSDLQRRTKREMVVGVTSNPMVDHMRQEEKDPNTCKVLQQGA